jgi:FAD/FMN-containing dehydrogenase
VTDAWTARHARKLERVVRQLRRHDPARPLSLRKKAVSHQVPRHDDPRRHDEKIDLRDLDEILEIDTEARICIAEPGVTFDALVRATLARGLMPLVVPELRTITIGGAVAGCSLESTSFRYGGFHDTCLEYEVVTATGEILRCAPDNEHRLVFQMMHGTFGTLGILTKLVFRLIPAAPFVHVTYHGHDTLEAYADEIHAHYVARDVDFVDGFLHGPDEHVLCLGELTDHAPYTHRYDWMRVYHRSTARRSEDWLRTIDYFFRYDNGVTNVHPKGAIGRLLFGKFVHSSQLLWLAHKLRRLLPRERPDVTVDLFVPFSRLDRFMSWYRREIDFFPLWCVPYRLVRHYEWIAADFFAGIDDELFVDLAIYGLAQADDRNLYKVIEDGLLEVRGIKTLISHNYYDEDVFWRIWNRPNYLAVKRITDPHGLFRDLYARTCAEAIALREAAAGMLKASPCVRCDATS